ncbi:MAG: pilus motility taxis protein HmpF [Gomphosphaeria aponina SAG 52.96 = DSM 107014]|uniref:Pilus motility taxis protein HmpF n=1 Tax=Gomphosphaeria aponina SAG 52.96 = DSM 107014 TaxID=1521640 RepID=A0A941JMB5_9CHRO|nr:pilus motility taxis protein HmpF [Gomphosphaeria aponina SAG 52.96 = DSM 107014]
MQYLAEVKKQTRGLMGGNKIELKLLACQRNDQTWTPVPREELIPCENVTQFGEGALLIVTLGANQQVQGAPELAGARLVRVLQTYSRLLEKSKEQEEEIEQWKQSLTYQSQELARREMEMETRIEQLEDKEKEYDRLQQQRRQLEESWQNLRASQQSLEQKQNALQESLFLEGEQVAKMQDLLEQLSSSFTGGNFFREQLRQIKEAVHTQQHNFNYHWQQLEQSKAVVKSSVQEVNHQGEELQRRKEELQAEQASLEEAVRELQVKRHELENKQEASRLLSLHLETIDEVRANLTGTGLVADFGDDEHKVDIVALENMPLGELQQRVDELKKETANLLNFVNLQEEELTLQAESIKELEEKLNQLGEFERLSMETELADAQESMKMLDETLIGQRRNLRRQQKMLGQNLRILKRRQGTLEADNDPEIELEPILRRLAVQENKTKQERQKLDSEIQAIQNTIHKMQEIIEQTKPKRRAKEQELQELEQRFEKVKIRLTEVMSQVSFSEKTLQPLQDNLDEIRSSLETIENDPNSAQNANEAIAEIQSFIRRFLDKLEMASF